MMGRVRSKDTKPEVKTRSAAHALGHRFRIHVADLPGKPDLANKARRWAIFVHGSFCEGLQMPADVRKSCLVAGVPASASRQGTNPRDRSYGDLANLDGWS
jgi:DNA mismatch endonuclease Vsr